MAATGQEVERRTSAQSEEGVAQHFSTEFFGLGKFYTFTIIEFKILSHGLMQLNLTSGLKKFQQVQQ